MTYDILESDFGSIIIAVHETDIRLINFQCGAGSIRIPSRRRCIYDFVRLIKSSKPQAQVKTNYARIQPILFSQHCESAILVRIS